MNEMIPLSAKNLPCLNNYIRYDSNYYKTSNCVYPQDEKSTRIKSLAVFARLAAHP